MEKLQLKKAEFIKEITSKRNYLFDNKFGKFDFMQAIENADKKFNEITTIQGFVWSETVKVSDTKIVFNRHGEKTLFLNEGRKKEYYKVIGNYKIDYLVMVQELINGIRTTRIYGIEKA